MVDNVGIDEPSTIDLRMALQAFTRGVNTVHREEVTIGGTAADGDTAVATVTDINPTGPMFGLVTRPITESAAGGLFVKITDGTDTALVTAGGLLQVDASGVAVPVTDNAGSLTVDGTVTANLAAGTNNIGDVDILTIAAGDNNIGNVDVVTLPAIPAGTNNIGDIDVLSVNSFVAHDTSVAGNPLLVAGAAQNTDDTAPPNRVSAEADATRFATDWDGSQFVRPHGPQVWSYHSDGSAALTDAAVHAAPGAGLSLYVTDIVVSSGAATAMNVFFEEGAAKVLGPYYLEAVAGRGLHIQFQTPKKVTANTALTVTTSAAIAHCVDVTGFTGQG